MVPRHSTPGGFAYIWQSKWVGIIAIKTERTKIHFLSDVLIAVALLDLKVPFKIQRRERQRERRKNNRFNKQNNKLARASNYICTFLSRFCTTTTWKCLVSRFMEDVNKQRRNIISLSELVYSHLKFSFRRVCLHLTKWVGRNNRYIDWKNVNSHLTRRSRYPRVVGS